MIGSRYLVAFFWISSATTALGNGAFDSTTAGIRDENSDGIHRSLRTTVSGNLFGSLFKKNVCRKTSEGIFETISIPRFRYRGIPGDGSCVDKCATLCPTNCFGSSKADGSKCTCGDYKCSGNDACVSDKCECKIGFSGNGLTCCDKSSGLVVSGSVCVAPNLPNTKTPASSKAPTKTPSQATTKTPTQATTRAPARAPAAPTALFIPTMTTNPGTPPVNTPPSSLVSPAVRAPNQLGRDIIKPKLVDFVALSPLKVDVSSAAGKIDFQITVQDTGSGVKTIFIRVDTRPRKVVYNKTFTTPINGQIVHSFSLPISSYVYTGSSYITMEIYDFAGNVLNISDPVVLGDRDFPYDIEMVNTKNDTLPPKLLGMKPLTPLVVNTTLLNSTGLALIIFEVEVEDDFSGVKAFSMFWRQQTIQGVSFLMGSLDFPDGTLDYDSIDFPLAGQPILVNMTVTVQKSIPLGLYSMRTALVQDFSGKISPYDATTLTSIMTIYNITIIA